MTKVISEFGSGVGEVALTKFQKRLAQNYFIALDAILKTTEEKRLKKSEKFRDAVPVTWQHVNMEKLARDVVAMARVGFDPSQPNHINPIPYKNKHTGKYDITFIEGYRGIELKATKYGLDVPDHVTVELVYSTDKFRPSRKIQRISMKAMSSRSSMPLTAGTLSEAFIITVIQRLQKRTSLSS